MTDTLTLAKRCEEAQGYKPGDDLSQLDALDELGIAINEALGIASYITDECSPALSIDDAVSLCERVLPGWGYFFRKDEEGCNAALTYPTAMRVTPGCGRHSTSPALALCAAILRAADRDQAK